MTDNKRDFTAETERFSQRTIEKVSSNASISVFRRGIPCVCVLNYHRRS
jgi:hypothetical protein